MVQTVTWATTYRAPNWLPSDTEESIVGTQWHQEANGQLAEMLRAVADRHGTSWGVCEGIALIGLRHKDGSDYDPKPDVMVLRQPLPDGNIASVRLDQVGAPLFIAELASDMTKRNDLGEKRAAYAAAGVAEYLVFDPGGHLLATPLVAWRLEGGVSVPWEPAPDGWWHSRVLEASFRPGHPFVAVRDRDGTVLEPAGVVRKRAREEARHRADLERRLAEQERRLAEERRVREEEARARAEEARLRAEAERRLAAEAQARAALEEMVERLRAQRDGPDVTPEVR